MAASASVSVQGAELEVLVPYNTNLTLEDLRRRNDVNSEEEQSTEVGGSQLLDVDTRRSLHFGRPRVRMQHPMIAFRASGVIYEPPATSMEESGDRYLPSGIPASPNVLESLAGDPALRGVRPRLTALRLDRISASTARVSSEQGIRSKPQKPFSAVPAISARVRYSRSSAPSNRPCTTASLDVETSPFQDEKVELTDVRMQLDNGSVEDLCIGRALNLPLTCGPRDNTIFLFRLMPNADHMQDPSINATSQTLDISLDACVLSADSCQPRIKMRWKTMVDFTAALNARHRGLGQNLQRNSRPPSTPIGPDKEMSEDVDTARGSNEKAQQQQQATSASELGLTLTLTGPKDVYVGQPFTWDVFVVNRSNKVRKLGLMVIPRRRFGEHKSHMSKTSISATTSSQRRDMDHADAIMDENRLYAIQKSNSKEAVDIVCLSTDVRLGNLNPGFCHNAELKFLPLAKGILHIEAVRVVDLGTSDSVDIRDLPEIVAEERAVDEKDS
ncbi:MAG: hypothetical protein Q9174_002391 [Haloplaca sp. 1 TL-2023]